MKNISLEIILIMLITVSFAYAHENGFVEAKQLIDSGVRCENLVEEQLELIGDYYMEQMHPGEAHELMDEMMGGEGSESLKQVHINMARRIYCNEDIYLGYGMMGSGSMMNKMWGNNFAGPGMMGSYGYGSGWSMFSLLFAGLLIGLLVLIILGIIKLLKDISKKKK